MTRLLSLFLAICILLGCTLTLASCGGQVPPDYPPDDNGGEGNNGENGEDGSKPSVVVPEFKDYLRDTVNFTELSYSRPDISALLTLLENACEAIKANELTFEEQLGKLDGIDELYTEMMSMYAMTNIYTSKDSSSSFWAGEYEYISSNLPSFSQKVEDLFVAAAQSPHAEQFEDEYFGEGLIEEYKDGGSYTDEIVVLMEKEAELEAEYSALSTATVVITYLDKEDTVDNLLAYYKDLYKNNTSEYFKKETTILQYYEYELIRLSKPIYKELISTRISLAAQFGYNNYAEYAYEAMGHEYSETEMMSLFTGIRDYIYPVYSKLYETTFKSYFNTTKMGEVDEITLINSLYTLYSQVDEDVFSAYCYMLQHGLYDIAPSATNRFESAFTTYIDGNNSPFIFMSTTGYNKDFSTLSHELGHFYDSFVNYGDDASLDLAEISSQGLEMLTLLSLEKILPAEQVQYLEYYSLLMSMDSMLYQGMIACFEHYAYRLSADQVTDENLNLAMETATELIFGNVFFSGGYEEAIMIHTVEYPFYVQSYCTSLIGALEIFLMEVDREGAGWTAYKALINRESEEYYDVLLDAGLSSPFAQDVLKNIADDIHYYVLGSHYFVSDGNFNNAA